MNHHDNLDVAVFNRDLDRLTDHNLTMTVPTLDETLLINSYEDNDGTTTLIADVVKHDGAISFYRQDEMPLQVQDFDPSVSAHARMAFTEPIHRLDMIKEGKMWVANLDPSRINNRVSVMGFITIASHFAAHKQDKLSRGLVKETR